MGRPHLPLGSYGEISCTEQPKTAAGKPRYKARARFRSADGVTRTVARFGQTKAAARSALREALTDAQHVAEQQTITPRMTVAALADLWLARDHDWTTSTRETYQYIVDNQVKVQLGGVRLAEMRPAVLNAALTRILDANGPGAAKTAKTVLAGMFKDAVAYNAINGNPARDAISIPRPRHTVRALTRDETDQLCDGLRCDERAVYLDLPDLVDFMLGTGARIGEACAARDATLDLEVGTWEINATVVRVKGGGLTIQQWPKTAAGWRVLALPPFVVEMVDRRRGELRFGRPQGVVFAAPRANALRDRSNTTRDLRQALDRLGFDWVTSHTFRKTVATRLDDAGLSSRQIADQLGHAKPSMTMDVYMGRKVVSAEAARLLDR